MLAVLLVLGIIVGLIVWKRRREEQRREQLEGEEDNRFGGLAGDVRMVKLLNYSFIISTDQSDYCHTQTRPEEVYGAGTLPIFVFQNCDGIYS